MTVRHQPSPPLTAKRVTHLAPPDLTLDRVQLIVQGQLHRHDCIDALLDRTLAATLFEDAINALDESRVMGLYPVQLTTNRRPDQLLIRLYPDDMDLIASLITHALGEQTERRPAWPICGLLCGSESSLADIAKWLTSHITVELNAPSMLRQTAPHEQFLFRFYDPRVFRALGHILKPQQLARLLRRTPQWLWLDSQGLHSYEPEPEINRLPLGPMGNPLALSAEQMAALDWIEPTNLACRQLLELGVDAPSLDALRVFEHVRQGATRDQIAPNDDLVTYALYAHFIHPQFMQHSAVQSLIRQRSPQTSMMDALSLLDEAQWPQLRADLERTPPHQINW